MLAISEELHVYPVHKVLPSATIWPWASLVVKIKINFKFLCDFEVENISVKLQNNACNSWHIVAFTRQFDHELAWNCRKVTQRSLSNFSEILMWRTSPVKLQYDADNLWGVIMFTRCYCLPSIWLPATHLTLSSAVQKGKTKVNENI